ncbi:MAG TPA: hypothetical protein VLZ74_09800 [Methylocella sp.]|nr:hypothetical protein [Methylocella sp.]
MAKLLSSPVVACTSGNTGRRYVVAKAETVLRFWTNAKGEQTEEASQEITLLAFRLRTGRGRSSAPAERP